MHRSHSLPDVTWTAGGPEATPPAAGKQTGGFEFKRFPRLLVALPVSSGRGECWNHTTRVTEIQKGCKRMQKEKEGPRPGRLGAILPQQLLPAGQQLPEQTRAKMKCIIKNANLIFPNM